MSRYEYDDGGRIAAGFPASGGDCLTRAVVIASGREYGETHKALSESCALYGNADRGVPTSDHWQKWMADNGFGESAIADGVGYDDERFKTGRYVMIIQIHGMVRDGIPVGHAFAMVDGVVRDTADYTKTSQLYAYWKLTEAAQMKAA